MKGVSIYLLLWLMQLLHGAVEVEAKLVSMTAVPKTEAIGTYSRALSLYEYEIQRVTKGELKEKKMNVLKWSIWQKRVLKNLPKKIGGVEKLKLVRFDKYLQYQNDRILGKVKSFDRVLMLDVGSIPRSGVKGEREKVLVEGKALRGVNRDWLFHRDEVRHIAAGAYWEGWKVGGTVDTLDVILNFQKRLKEKGVKLVLVPVPVKAAVMKDHFSGFEPDNVSPAVYGVFRKHGIAVIDLHQIYRKKRKNSNARELYCKTDSHWSAEGAKVAAEAVARELKGSLDKDLVKAEYEESFTNLIRVKGDLLEESDKRRETLAYETVNLNGELVSKKQLDSPIVVVGDSHVVFCSDKEHFYVNGSGFTDQFALASGVAPDVISSFGSGIHGARVGLFRQRGNEKKYWENKKILVWVFSERELSKPNRLSIKVPLAK